MPNIHIIVKRSAAQRSAAQRSAAQRSAAQRSAAQRSAAQRSAAQRSAAQRSAAQRSAAQRSAAQRSAAQRSAAQRSAAQRSAAQRSAAQRSAAQRSAAQRSAAQRSAAQRSAAQRSAAQRSAAQRSAAQRSAAQRSAAQRSAAQRSAAQRSAAQRSAAQRSAAQRSAAQRSAAQRSAAQRSAAQRSAAQRSAAQRSAAQRSAAQRSAAQIITYCILVLCYLPSKAQSELSETDFDEKSIDQGITLKSLKSDTLIGLPQLIFVVTIDPSVASSALSLAYSDYRKKTSAQAKEHQGNIAINGSFFNMDTGEPACFLKINDTIRGVSRYDLKPNYFLDQLDEAAVVVSPDNLLEIIQKPSCGGWESLDQYPDVMVSGPLLVWDGKPVELDTIPFNRTRYARTGACTTTTGKMVFFTVDGGADQASGMTMHEFALLMESQDCEDGINLDGGGSTTLWTQEQSVVNHPTDNKAFDHYGERPVSSIILLKKIYSEN